MKESAKKTASIHNLGCKVNAYEAEAVEKLLKDAGYRIVPFSEKADVVIINTCTVTSVADKKSRQMLHRAKAQNPAAVVVAMGCYAETGKEKLQKDEGVDILIGNNRKKDIAAILDEWFAGKEGSDRYDGTVKNGPDRCDGTVKKGAAWYDEIAQKGAAYEEFHSGPEPNRQSISAPSSHTRAFVKIQDGCDRFCSYCIIPYARGRIRSRHRADVEQECKDLAAGGIREIVLTGIHISSYGKDGGTDCDLITLIERIHETEGICRIRLGSLEPGIITEDFARRLSALPMVCPHFHLSLQSGCDATLKRMRRHYTAAEYYEKCRILRGSFDRPALTTDIIAGFPGETDEDFEASYAFVKKTGFFETHIFPYSRRAGTEAAKMPDQIPESIKKERVRRLIELNEIQRKSFLSLFQNEPKEVLFEDREMINGTACWSGHTARYEKLYYQSSEDLCNKILTLNNNEFVGTC